MRLALAALLLAAAALATAAQAPDLPSGPLRQKARTACLECHDAHIIVQQRLDRKTWTKEIDKMIRWGAVVDPRDREAFIEYFSGHFRSDGERPAASPPKAQARPD